MTHIVTNQQAGRTVKSVLQKDLLLSTSLLNTIKRRPGALLLNGVPVFVTKTVAAGDVLQVDLSDPPNPSPVPAVAIPLDILYEDDALLAINKSAPLPVHASSFAPDEVTLANGLAAYLGESATFHPVNRLDRGTTGVMVVAKSRYVHNLLRQQLHTEKFCREYRGVAVGTVTPASGRIDAPIGRAPGSPILRMVCSHGLPAVTEYETLGSAGGFTLLRLCPHTGRTHQLRLHMAYLGYPLAGDWLYGTEDRVLIPRPALHAFRLTLCHPISGETLELEAPIPEDMTRLLPGISDL